MTQTRAVIELVFAAMLWGMGFVATVWCLRGAGPMAISGWRFVIAGIAGVFFARKLILARRANGRGLSFTKTAREFMKSAWLPGMLIAGTVYFQSWGLLYTTATKSGFLTCLYVLIVPFMEPFVGGQRPSQKLVVCSLIALVGVALMCGVLSGEELDERSRLNVGDFLTLICAFLASAHIFVIAAVHKRLGNEFNGFHFNTAQSFGAGLPTLALAIAIEPGAFQMPATLVGIAGRGESLLPLLGFLSLAFCSTLIGFALQVRAQRVLSPSTASLLFLLESPFAALFALMFLGETMGPTQLIGGALILASVAYSTLAAIRPREVAIV